jgi:hypothetical protein
VFSFLSSHSNKLYQEGYFLKLNDLDTNGKPNADRNWTECFAQLVGTILSLWDAAALDVAGQDGEVAPTFVNLADASIKMVRGIVQLQHWCANTGSDPAAAHSKRRRAAPAECPVDIYCRQEPIPLPLQLHPLVDTMDCWDSAGNVRELVPAGAIYWVVDRWKGQDAEQHQVNYGAHKIPL